MCPILKKTSVTINTSRGPMTVRRMQQVGDTREHQLRTQPMRQPDVMNEFFHPNFSAGGSKRNRAFQRSARGRFDLGFI